MAARHSLPPALGSIFSTAAASAAGVPPGRLRSSDLTQPFRGVNVLGAAHDVRGRAIACAERMTGRWAFCSVTAAVLHGVPLPLGLASPYRALDVAVVAPRTPPRAEGIIGHKYQPRTVALTTIADVPVCSAPDVWCQIAPVISREDLVAAGDFLLSGDPAEGRSRRERCTVEQLEAAVRRYSGKRGAKNLRWALTRLRAGVDSRPESLLRLMLVEAGLPEPIVHWAIAVGDGSVTLHPDLALPRWCVAFEYQGDGHRDRARFLGDIDRHEMLRAAGWEVIEVSSKDLFEDREAFLRRVEAVLRRRGFLAK